MLTACRVPLLMWDDFWRHLEEDECLWARQQLAVGREDFQRTIETMLRYCIPAELKTRLSRAWSALALEHPLEHCANYNLWYELETTLPDADYSADEEDAKALLDFLWHSQSMEMARNKPVTPESVLAAQAFLMELKFAALGSLQNFRGIWSCFISSLPREVVRELSACLFTLTMIILLHELK